MEGSGRGDGGEMEGRWRGDGGEMEGRWRVCVLHARASRRRARDLEYRTIGGIISSYID